MYRLAVFVLFPSFLFAQPASSKNGNRVWSVTLEQDWVVDNPSLEYEWDDGLSTLKLLCNRDDGYASSPFLSVLIYNAVSLEDLQIYEDPDCRIPTTWHKIRMAMNTVAWVDPETGEEKIQIATCSDYNPSEAFKAWRLRQVLTYDEKTAEWRSTVQAIAPLVQVNNNNGDSISLRPEFWFRPENKRPDLNSKNIIWAKQVTNRRPETHLPEEWIKPLSGQDTVALPLRFKELVENQLNIPLYADANGEELLTPEVRRSMIVYTDTFVYCFSEGPKGETIGIVSYNRLADVHSFRFLQTWYWDRRRKRLSICLDAVAPLLDNNRYKKPLFYRRTRR